MGAPLWRLAAMELAPEPPASHDKRPLPRRIGDDPPQPENKGKPMTPE